MDVTRLRSRFPALRSGNGIYFDNAATSLAPDRVVDEVARYFAEYNVNAGRAAYLRAAKLSAEIEDSRETIAAFIGASPEEIVFTFNTTDAINRLALSLPFRVGERIVVTDLEHHSNLLPWRIAAKRNNLDIKIVRRTAEGFIEPAEAGKVLSSGSRLFAFTAASNVLGTIQKVKDLSRIARDNGALVFVDAAQLAGHRSMNVKVLGCDFLAFSGHKMCGPQGVGVLYVSKNTQQILEPAYLGGGTVRSVSHSEYTLKDFPYLFEAGTLNLAGLLGLRMAVKFLEEIGMTQIEDRTSKLHALLHKGLRESKGVEIYTSENGENVGITAFNLKGYTPHEAALQYDRIGKIMLRSGFHCAIPLVKTLGDGQGTLRTSVAFYNTEDEVLRFLDVTKTITGKL